MLLLLPFALVEAQMLRNAVLWTFFPSDVRIFMKAGKAGMSDTKESADPIPAPSAPEEVESDSEGSQLQKSTYLLLKAFAKTYKKIRFDFPSFVKFTAAYVEQYGSRFRDLQIFAANPKALLFKSLEELERKSRVHLAYRGAAIESIYFPAYCTMLLKKAYSEIARNPEIPFPTDENIGISLPSELVNAADVPNGLLNLMRENPSDSQQAIRLTFPGNLQSILIVPEILPKQLLDYAINKIRIYLNRSTNASYMQSRLRPAFRDHQVSMQTTVNNIIIKPSAAAAAVMEASDFSFRFWAHFSNMMAREQNEKRDLLQAERSLAQSAYIMGAMNVYYRELVRNKENEKAETLKVLEKELKRPPYAFTLKDLLGLKDKKGGALVTQDDMERVTGFLTAKTKPANNRILPELVVIRAGPGRDYYIYKSLIPLVFIQKLRETSSAMRDFYLESWPESIRRDEKPSAMDDDNQFLADLRARVSARYPLLDALLDYSLLTSVERETTIRSELLAEYNACINRRVGKLKPLNEILRLDRKELARITKRNLRFWERYQMLRRIMRFLLGLFRAFSSQPSPAGQSGQAKNLKKGFVKIKTGDEPPIAAYEKSSKPGMSGSSAVSYADRKAAYQKAIVALKEEFVGKGSSIPRALSDLADKWNPLFAEKPRKDLVEDVNSMIRDYVRGLRKGFRIKPPDAERIRALAHKLSQHSTFERISKKDLFQSYIEIYMISLLGDLVTTRRK
jgi:hypothetical protein